MKSGYKHLSSTDIFSMRADEHDDKPLVITLNSTSTLPDGLVLLHIHFDCSCFLTFQINDALRRRKVSFLNSLFLFNTIRDKIY